jgi:nucleoside-diphosphate-sugar epimerase
MKVFVTGIAGFLGSHVADSLLKAGHEVSGCDNLIGGYLDNVPEEAEFFQVDATFLVWQGMVNKKLLRLQKICFLSLKIPMGLQKLLQKNL